MTVAIDGRVHHEVLSTIVRQGYPPNRDEIASALAITPEVVEGSLRRLHNGHGLVLHPESVDVWIAHPFSASPTAVWVAAGATGWWAPCMWCAMGIVTLAAPTATIHARFAGEHGEARVEILNETIVSDDFVVHFALPPREAWRNVVHWCSTVLPFRNAREIAGWCERHRLPRGAVVPAAQVLALGRAWYGRHLEETWRKWSIEEAQAIFDEVGLRGDFWQLPVSEGTF